MAIDALYPARPIDFAGETAVWEAWGSATLALDVSAAPRAPRPALQSRQRERLAALLASAARDSPRFRRLLAGRDPERVALADLPPSTKAELMAGFDDWVADPRLRLDELHRFLRDPGRIGEPYLGRYAVWESSGSSGEPGVFVQDPPALAVYELLENLRRPSLQPLRRALDPWYATERIAFVGAVDGHFASVAWLRRIALRQPWTASRMQLHSFLQPLPQLCRDLQAQAPTVLATYPSVAWTLAEEAAAGRLSLPLKEVWTGGEGLSEAARTFVTRSLGCPVAQSYGASEFLPMAAECRHGRLHVNSDWLILEPVDARGDPVAPGDPSSSVLLTNLANRVQPLVRYDLGDRVRLDASPCDCGSSLPVVEVAGRADDALVLHDGAGHGVRLSPLALTTVLEEDAGLFAFQLRQQGPRSLRLQVAGSAASAKQAREALERYLHAQGLAGVRVRTACGPVAERGRSGKVKRIVAKNA